MAFWDFVAPDLAGFKAALDDWLPELSILGDVAVTKDMVCTEGYDEPASPAGVACRTAYGLSQSIGVAPASSQNCVANMFDNMSRGGVETPGPSFLGRDLTEGSAMAPLVIANTYECTVRAISGGRAIDNVLFFQGSGAGQEVACCTAFQSAWKTTLGMMTRLDSKYTLVSFTAVDLSTSSGGIWIIADTTAGSRTTTDYATRAACALIQYNGGTRNRSSRGRTYFGPLYEGDINSDGATLFPSSSTSLMTAVTNMRSVMTTAGFSQVVASRKLSTAYPITRTVISTTIATQRRRLRA